MSKVNLRIGGWAIRRQLLLLGALCLVFMPSWQIARGIGAGAVYGPYGPEGLRLREQLWVVPGGDPNVPLRATVFRPPENAPGASVPAALKSSGGARRPLVVINHGSDESTREAVSMPVFYWLSKWFVDRGYVVVLPQRRGHGATGGDLAEGRDTCANPDHYAAGLAAADDIEAVLRYMAGQSFIDPGQLVVAGVSTGGWASLALASRNPLGVELVVNFAGGRGGHAYGEPNAVCGQDRLIEAAGAYGHGAKVPTLWIYAANDSYFGPDLATSMALAWKSGGGRADLRLLPVYGSEGHDVVSARAGWRLWGRELESSLAHLTEARRVRTSHAR
jgi:dienelactone hydrolase